MSRTRQWRVPTENYLGLLYLVVIVVNQVGGDLNFSRRGLVAILGRVLVAAQPNQACTQKY